MKILIAEDDYLISMILEQMVCKMGYKVVSVCRSGKETIKEVINKKPDCILMDLFLKDDLNGFDVMMTVREHLQAPVVFITGQQISLLSSELKKIKNSRFISKPFTYKALEQAIEAVAGKKNH